LPPGVSFAPLGELGPQGWTLNCLEEWRDEQRIPPQGDLFTPREKNSPLGDNFAPWGQSLP
jgi:hypothetical protein